MIVALHTPSDRRAVGTVCEDRGIDPGNAIILSKNDRAQPTCPWCLGARNGYEAKKIVNELYERLARAVPYQKDPVNE